MADAQASGACSRKAVWVQVPSPAWNRQVFGNRHLAIFLFRIAFEMRCFYVMINR